MWIKRLAAGLLVLAGALLLWRALVPVVRAHAAHDWRVAECRVYSSHLSEPGARKNAPHVHLSYVYRVEGTWYDGEDASFVDGDATAVGLGELTTGARLPCLYDPTAPEHAVLARVGWTGSSWVALLFGFALLAYGSMALHHTTGPRAGSVPLALVASVAVALGWTVPGVGGTTTDGVVLAVLAVAAIARIVQVWPRPARGALPHAIVR
jgi:Protein of unknown function (DUF3592)